MCKDLACDCDFALSGVKDIPFRLVDLATSDGANVWGDMPAYRRRFGIFGSLQ